VTGEPQVEHKVSLARHEAARWIADVAVALSGDGPVSIRLAGSTVELEVPDHVRCEAEVEVDGDEVELEFELKWSTAPQRTAVLQPDGVAHV
jgi:amphi-Trp domain-containing protein